MKPVSDQVRFLDGTTVELTVRRIRRDPVLGRGSFSSWEEVTPSDYEAAERVRALIEEGVVRVDGAATPDAIVRALRAAERSFWATGEG
jgi:hypothetical protein